MVYLGNGDGTFHATPVTISLTNPFSAIASADFNQDGNLDVVVGDASSGSISILRGDGTGKLVFPPTANDTLPIPPVNGSIALTIVDANADGFPDILVTENEIAIPSNPIGEEKQHVRPQLTPISGPGAGGELTTGFAPV